MTDGVAGLEQELRERRDALEEAQAAEAEARGRARANPDDDDAIAASLKAQARVQALTGRITDLEAEIQEARDRAITDAAVQRLSKGLPRAYGSVRNEHEKDRERVRRLEQELTEARKRIPAREDRLDGLAFESAVLSLRFSLPAHPDLPAPTRARVENSPLEITPSEDGQAVTVKGTFGRRTITGPSGRILAEAGRWERTPQEAHRVRIARNEAEEAERQEARDHVDGWLRDRLTDGPAARDRLAVLAEEAGIPWRSPSGPERASISDAARRLRVRAWVTKDAAKALFWALPDTPGAKLGGLRPYQGETARSRAMSAAMR